MWHVSFMMSKPPAILFLNTSGKTGFEKEPCAHIKNEVPISFLFYVYSSADTYSIVSSVYHLTTVELSS